VLLAISRPSSRLAVADSMTGNVATTMVASRDPAITAAAADGKCLRARGALRHSGRTISPM